MTCVTPLAPLTRTSRPDGHSVPATGEALYQLGSVRASYFHAWFASSCEATAKLFRTGAGE